MSSEGDGGAFLSLRICFLLFWVLLCEVTGPVLADGQEPFYRSEFIFQSDAVLQPHVHASSIVELPNGDLLVAWYAGRTDKSKDVLILGARLPKGSAQWTKPDIFADTPGLSDNNPVLFLDDKKQLWLFYSTLLGKSWDSAIIKYKNAPKYLNEISWNEEQILQVPAVTWLQVFVRKKGWMTRNHPIILNNGNLLLPFYSDALDFSLMAISGDGGTTWKYSKPIISGKGNIQPTIVQLGDGSLLAYMRDGSARHRVWRSMSADNGWTWTRPTQSGAKDSRFSKAKTELPNPGSALEMIRLSDGYLVLAFNDCDEDRSVLTLALSTDEGQTWNIKRNLEGKPGERFDYPSLVQTQDALIHVTYSCNVKSIKHVGVNETWIQEGGK
jgi:predicted neuraminidase